MDWRNMMGVSRDEYQKNKTPQNLRKIRKNPVDSENRAIIANIANNANSNEKVKIVRGEFRSNSFFDHHMDAAIADLNRLGIRMMAVPEVKRQEAFTLEGELTDAANRGERKQFLELLERWRECFH